MNDAHDMTVPRCPEHSLSGKQRRHLRGAAHHIVPVVQVGKEGVTAAVVGAVTAALEDHELIKVRILESAPIDLTEASERFAQNCGAHVVGKIGRIAILYRRRLHEPVLTLPP